MSSNSEIVGKFLLRRCILAIVLCTSAWWVCADTHAQEAALTPSKMTARSTFRSLEGPASNTVPHLVIGRADCGDTPSYGSLRPARDEAANPYAKNTDFHAEGTIRRQIIQSSPDQAGANVYSLLDDRSVLGLSMHGYRMKYFPSKRWLADSESFTHEKSSSARPRSGATTRTTKQAAAIILLISVSQFPHGH
jgi:hypothetical protein